MKQFSDKIRCLRLERNLTQADVARDLGVSVASYSAYESIREPNYDTLIKLAKFFEVSIDYLLGVSECKNSKYIGICEETGLKDESVQNLRLCHEKGYLINEFMNNPAFTTILRKFTEYVGFDDEALINGLPDYLSMENQPTCINLVTYFEKNPVSESLKQDAIIQLSRVFNKQKHESK